MRTPVPESRGTDAARFTSELWDAARPIYNAILEHPFILGLTEGTLERRSFEFYMVQDALYLGVFARALSLLAAKAPHEEATRMFDGHAAGALLVERALHESFFRELGLSEADVRSTPLAPTNLAYTNHLLAVAHARPVHEGIAAVLPCYWIYWEVGQALLEGGSPDPLYRRWIETYGAPEFGALVEAVRRLTDDLATTLGAAERQAMRRHFVTSSRYEWMFWDMGLHRETWPL